MLDLLLANKLAKAVAPGAHLLFVGDVDQLPSVGAGEVLRDLLSDGSPIPAVRLTRIFRQAQGSAVGTTALPVRATSTASSSRPSPRPGPACRRSGSAPGCSASATRSPRSATTTK